MVWGLSNICCHGYNRTPPINGDTHWEPPNHSGFNNQYLPGDSKCVWHSAVDVPLEREVSSKRGVHYRGEGGGAALTSFTLVK